AVGDMNIPRKGYDMPLSRYRRINIQAAQFKCSNINVEIGQQRIVRLRRFFQFGKPEQTRTRNIQRADIYMAGYEGQRTPINRNLRRRKKHAFRVADSKVAYSHLVMDRALNGADFECHAIFKLKAFNLVDDKPLAA